MKPFLLFASLSVMGSVLIGCGGASQNYDQTPVQVTQAPVGDWTIQLSPDDGLHSRSTTRGGGSTTDLGNLESLTAFPGFTYPSFGQFTTFLALSLNGFTGTIQLADVPSGTADHIPCQFSASSGTPTSTLTVSPSTNGVAFTVSYTVPSNYTYPTTTLKFQASDSSGRIKTVEMPLTLQNYTGSFSPQTFSSGQSTGSGSLVITPHDLYGGSVTITFDTTILAGDNVPTAFDNPIPGTVTVTAPQSPVTLPSSSSVPSVTTPVNFSWTNWPAGQYAVIAVVSYPVTVGGQGPVIRVPCEITVTTPAD
jgi:hypothetical protein